MRLSRAASVALVLLAGIGPIPTGADESNGARAQGAVSLTLIPPSPVTDLISLDIRGAVRNEADTAKTFDVAVYWDAEVPDRCVHQATLQVAPKSAAG
ncbi:MAG TPA: hypothetical protein PKM43_13865, partial [Verrucomicrobiota bacterium]|nr:hypothetical protein [Verrucomicrobiota bacterium]